MAEHQLPPATAKRLSEAYVQAAQAADRFNELLAVSRELLGIEDDVPSRIDFERGMLVTQDESDAD